MEEWRSLRGDHERKLNSISMMFSYMYLVCNGWKEMINERAKAYKFVRLLDLSEG